MLLPKSTTPTESSSLPVLPAGETPEIIRDRIPRLKGFVEKAYMYLAKDLWSVYKRKLYTKWGHNTFNDYVINEVGISKDYARQMRKIFSVLVMKCHIQPKELDEIGRSKARKLLAVVDQTNARAWITKAKSLKYDELSREVENEVLRNIPISPEPTSPETSHKRGPVTLAKKTNSTKRVAEVFRPRTFRLPEDSSAVLDEALAEAQRITNSPSDGFNLSCIAQQFLAHRLTVEGKDDGRMAWFMKTMEQVYGGRFIHIRDEGAWDVLRKAVEESPDLTTTSIKEDEDVESTFTNRDHRDDNDVNNRDPQGGEEAS